MLVPGTIMSVPGTNVSIPGTNVSYPGHGLLNTRPYMSHLRGQN